MTVKEIQNAVVSIIRKNLGAHAKIYLFGSWARGDAQPNSDIDIAIDMGDKINPDFFYRIKREIETIPTLRKIDIVDLNAAGKKFSDNILSYAITL
jgi:predicted nucleotidyltransferase